MINKGLKWMTRIGFIRHGNTDWNVEKRAQGQMDIPLNETGRQQAHALAERLQHEPWEIIYSSDLSRAADTAQAVAAALGLDVHKDERLREKSWGKLEGTTVEDRVKKWGNDWKSLQLDIETEESMKDRGLSFIKEICSKHPDQEVLVVSHGALLGRLFDSLIPDARTNELLGNTSLTIVTNSAGQWDCSLYNCTKHLD